MRVRTFAFGVVLALLALAATRPILNASGMCTEGAIPNWRYESIEDTLAFLNKHKPISAPLADAPRLATRYSDAALAKSPVDGFPSRSIVNAAAGTERFLIKVEVDRLVAGNPRTETKFFFSPNCLRLPFRGR